MGYRQKEACEVIFDACMSSTEPCLLFAKESKFSLGKKLADHYIRRFLQEQRKTDQVGVIATGGPDGAQEIVLLQSILITHRQKLEEVEADEDTEADISDALELAAEKIEERAPSRLKFKRTIAIFTDGTSVPSLKTLKAAKSTLDDGLIDNIEIFGIDFGMEGRSEQLQKAEEYLRLVFGDESVHPLTLENILKPHRHVVGQVKKWKGEMEVSSYIKFHVIMVARIAEDKLKPLEKKSRLALEAAEAGAGTEPQKQIELLSTGMGAVKMDRKYTSSEDVETEVAPEDRSRSFKYGKDILPMFPADEEAMKLEDNKSCLKVIGIIKRSDLIRNYMISSTNCIVAEPGSESSQEGFSAFVRALRDLDKVATARYVRKDGTNPKFVCLIPGYLPEGSPAAGGDCLWQVQLPTTEDLRDYQFESLSKVVISEHEEKVAADYVKSMTLIPGDAPETNGYDPLSTFNPVIARFWDSVHTKALDPERPLPPASALVTSMITPDPNVVKRANKYVRKFGKTFPLHRVVKKRDRPTGIEAAQANEEKSGQQQQEGDGGDDADWFKDEAKSIVEYVGTANPVEDFWAMLEQSQKSTVDRTEQAFRGIFTVIRDLVGPDGDPLFHDKAIACLKAFREGSLKYHWEVKFNEYLTELKSGLLCQSATDPFWQMIVDNNITLISSEDTHDVDNVSQEDAKNFLSSASTQATTQTTTQSAPSQPRVFDDDLFDSME